MDDLIKAYNTCGYRKATESGWVPGSGHVTNICIGDPHAESDVRIVWHRKNFVLQDILHIL